MFVPSFILIERDLDGGPILHTKQDAFFSSKISEYQCFAVCCPKLAFVPASRQNCHANKSYVNFCSKFR